MRHTVEETRARLIEEATRAFAEDGVHTASLLEISRRAGQRNRGAVHYHFGSRMGMVAAVLGQHLDLVAARERELLDLAHASPAADLAPVVSALVLPCLELADLGSPGRWYLMVLNELTEEGLDSLDPDVYEVVEQLGGFEVLDLLEERIPPIPDDVRAERIPLVTSFILHSIAARGRALEQRPPSGRAQLATEPFAQNLIAMVVAMLRAPVG